MATFKVLEYWDDRYEKGYSSGPGSSGVQLVRKMQWLSNLDINSISEVGCGDFNLGRHLLEMYPNTPYVGQDISKVIIEKNWKLLYPGAVFTTDILNIPSAELLVCADVLFHIIDDLQYEEMLNILESKWTKYLTITAYENEQVTSPHLKVRKFDSTRFGKPLIREIVQEDGQLYFYLFKKPSVDLSQVSCCLITKDHEYPKEILDNIAQYPFGEVLILTDSDSPYRKHELFAKAKFDLIYYQDDDAICPIKELVQHSDTNKINVAMKPGHFEQYKGTKMTMGLGWGAIFPKKLLASLSRYTDKYGEDALFKRETERIFTYLNWPQNRVYEFPIQDLPSAYAADRLWRQPQHYDNIKIVEERCSVL